MYIYPTLFLTFEFKTPEVLRGKKIFSFDKPSFRSRMETCQIFFFRKKKVRKKKFQQNKQLREFEECFIFFFKLLLAESLQSESVQIEVWKAERSVR